ncbi:NUDIX domain-containing protein [Veronia pacifica]|uniref:DNA mismatch repair protein MutT n=1 Tax=Veronia pacifica TaxID=1080227 RepID=A0A1C3ELF4_9GAMM|nr:NUDIX domain-containing protein [Veronia pacifica]ODA34050.1 DNA mismatch repair protein MutT [Veronia pacifica]
MQYDLNHHIEITAQAAGAVIFNEQNEVLLVKEMLGSKKGLWHIPSGSVEKDEFPVNTAEREVKEETGLTLTLNHYLNTYVGRFDDGELVLRHVWFSTYPTDQAVLPSFSDEIDCARFFSREEVIALCKEKKLRMHHTMLMIEDGFAFIHQKRLNKEQTWCISP